MGFITVSEFLKLNREELEEYIKLCVSEPKQPDADVNLHLTGWVSKGKIIKRSFSHGFVMSHVYFCRKSLKSNITFYSRNMESRSSYFIARIIFNSRSCKVIRMCYGDENAKGNRLINVPKEKSFWNPKRNKWRWEE